MAGDGLPTQKPQGPPPSAIQTAPNLVAFDPKLAVPSQQIYLQRNDLLAFNVLTNGNNISLRIDYRWLTPEGEIKEGESNQLFISGSGFFSFPLYEGWLLSFAARVTSAPVLYQLNFLQAFITRAQVPNSQSPMYALFWQGFIYQNTANGWPGTPAREITDGPGIIRSVTGSTPGIGNEISETVTTQRRWNLLAFRATLTTSATVANRSPVLLFTDGALTFFRGQCYFTQTASVGAFYSAAQNPPGATPTNGDQVLTTMLPMPLKAGFKIQTNTLGLQAGDQWSAPQYLVQEWGNWDI